MSVKENSCFLRNAGIHFVLVAQEISYFGMKLDIICHQFLMAALPAQMAVKILKRANNAIVKNMILYKMHGNNLSQMSLKNGMMSKISL